MNALRIPKLKRLLLLPLAILAAFLASCYDDDDDCHSHYVSTGVIVYHCHDDDDFDDDDDYHDHYYYQSGEVAVLVTDAPVDDVRSFEVTITEVVLQSSEVDPQTVYSSPRGLRLDLLALAGSEETRLFELLSGRLAVAPATYDSIRLAIKDPRIILHSGEVVDAERIALWREGHIDVSLAEPFPLGPSDVAFIVLDFDLERSLLAPAGDADTGEGGADPGARWTFRPLVVVDVQRDDPRARVHTPLDVAGTVTAVDLDAGTFTLALPGGDAGTIEVSSADAAAGAVVAGEAASVRGVWNADGGLDARAVVLGATSRLDGLVRELREDGEDLTLIIEEPGSPREIEVAVTAETVLSFGRLSPAVPGDLQPGRKVSVTARDAVPGAVPGAVRVDLEAPALAPGSGALRLR
jgi:hypothetical protein